VVVPPVVVPVVEPAPPIVPPIVPLIGSVDEPIGAVLGEPIVPPVVPDVPVPVVGSVPIVVEPVVEPDVPVVPVWPERWPLRRDWVDVVVLGEVVCGVLAPVVPAWPDIEPPVVLEPVVCAIAAAGMMSAAIPKVLIRRIVSLLSYGKQTPFRFNCSPV
jgi:hypothetical protein